MVMIIFMEKFQNFKIYFEDSQIVDDAQCNIIETDPECEPAGDADEEAQIFKYLKY